jgi:malate dehydrogenase (oxaloacetate-decarboxylating)(NADP+)
MLQLIGKALGIYRCYYKYDVDKAWTDVLVRYRINIDPTADDLAKSAIMTAKRKPLNGVEPVIPWFHFQTLGLPQIKCKSKRL